MLQGYAEQGVKCVALDVNPDMLAFHEAAEEERRSRARTPHDTQQRVFPVRADMRESLLAQLAEHDIRPGAFDAVHIRAATAYLNEGQEARLLEDVYHSLAEGGRYVNPENVWRTVAEQQVNPWMQQIARLADDVERLELGFRGNHGLSVPRTIGQVWSRLSAAEGRQIYVDTDRLDFAENTSDEWYKIIQMLRHPIAGGTERQSQLDAVPLLKRQQLAAISEEATYYFDRIDEDAALPQKWRSPIGHPSFVAGIAIKGTVSSR
jgi:SAM-dependent methyltransferase